ncbi:MAG: hypothetical protein J1F41_07345 [Lachnospiraceae bacterium]|nr:hypothetical protein [Lachnospiraceae bacterium]
MMEQWQEIRIPEIQKQPNKSRKTAVPVTAVSVIAIGLILLAAAAFWFFKIYRSDERKLLNGFRNLAQEIEERQILWEQAEGNAPARNRNCKIETSFNLSGEKLPVTLGVDTTILRDAEAHKLRSSTDLSVMNRKIVETELYGEDEVLMLALPDIFRQNLAFDTKRIDRQYNNSLLAEKFGRIEKGELSIDLFPEEREQTWGTPEDWENFLSDLKKNIGSSEDSARINIEKLDESVVIEVPDTVNRQYQCSQYRMIYPKEMLGSVETNGIKITIQEDLVLLTALDNNDRIIQIALDEPLEYTVEFESTRFLVKTDGSICFLGEGRSIDDIVVSMDMSMMQTEQSEGEDSLFSSLRKFLKLEDTRYEIQSNFHILYSENDTRVTTNINQLTASFGNAGDYKVTGEINLEPLQEEIEPLEGETLQVFEVTEEEYEDLEDQLRQTIKKWLRALSYLYFVN